MQTPEVEVARAADLAGVVAQRGTSRGGATYVQSSDGTQRLAYDELAACVAAWPAFLRANGVAPGARVGLLVADPVAFARCFVSAIAAGLWVVPMDPSDTDEATARLALQARATRLELVISDRGVRGDVDAAHLDAGSTPDGATGAQVAEGGPLGASGGVVLSSSGTTGAPKVMALSASQLVRTASLVASHLALDEDERGFNPLPLWHVNAEVVGLLATLVGGSSLVLDQGFHRTEFWARLGRHGVTWINAVPAIVARLSTVRAGESIPEGIRLLRSASAPLSPVVQERFESATGIPVVQSYGMTEAASQICSNPVQGDRKAGSVGPPIGVELRIVDGDAPSIDVDAPTVGHVEVRGPTVITRYEGGGYEDRFDPEGWLRTGDLGFMDRDGYLHLVGRSDDVINRGGEKVFPQELEDVLLRISGVVAAAVIGEDDEVYGQVPVAYVALKDVSETTSPDERRRVTEAVAAELAASVSRARRPARLLVVATLPAQAVGKVSRAALRRAEVDVLYRHELS